MKWKTFQKIYRELKASNYSPTGKITIKYVHRNKQRGQTICSLRDFKENAWTIYDKDPIMIVVGVESKTSTKPVYKYILFNNPEEMPQLNDNFYVRYFMAMQDKSKKVINELLMRQLAEYLDEPNENKNSSD